MTLGGRMIFEAIREIRQTIIYYLLFLYYMVVPSSGFEAEERIKRIKMQKKILNACKGDRNAQYEAGVYWAERSNSRITEADEELKEALRWFTLASDQGHSKATYELACLYLVGRDNELSRYRILKDPNKGFELMKKSAYQGENIAQYKLGMMYREGNIALKDRDKAKQWIEKARSKFLDALTPVAAVEIGKIWKEEYSEQPNEILEGKIRRNDAIIKQHEKYRTIDELRADLKDEHKTYL